MKRFIDRAYASLSAETGRPAAFRYGFGLCILGLIVETVRLQIRYPQFTSGHLGLFVVVLMLLLNYLAASFAWSSPRTRFLLNVASWSWILFAFIFSLCGH